MGNICSLKKSGNGGIEPSLLSAIYQAGKPVGQSIIKNMTDALEKEELRLATDDTEPCLIIR